MNDHDLFITLHNDYAKTTVGFFRGASCIATQSIPNKSTSKQLLTTIDSLLKKNHATIKNCTFFAVHQGPGPFTTLRVVVATINGLAFATKIPIVGVNGISTFVHEHQNQNSDYTIALLNAFCNDVYYAISDTKNNTIDTGCKTREDTLHCINQLPGKSITLIGNAILENRCEIEKTITKSITIPDPLPDFVSLEAIGQQAYKQWQSQENIYNQVMPLYLKRPAVYTNA